jgi:SagB-type dehydrogenase family enzyme
MDAADAYDTVVNYHHSTKHRFQAYARGPETLDWDAQPAPFRRYEGAPIQILPLSAPRYECSFGQLYEPGRATAAPADRQAVGALLQLSFAVSAWKSNGVERWAVRCNPSSGNLHPTEVYLLASGIEGLADGVHHYRADDHALEMRASWSPHGGPPALHLALSSVIWREAWKYGERAFRYGQLDLGHAAACVAYAAALLGWRVAEIRGITPEQLGALLGLDRDDDFTGSHRADVEREEPEMLLALSVDSIAGGIDATDEAEVLCARACGARWHGRASTIDPRPVYHWPILGAIAAATARRNADAPAPGDHIRLPPLTHIAARRGAVETILGRRSAQRYDGSSVMRTVQFSHLLDATLQRPQQPPWQTLRDPVRIALLLFVHRVEGLVPGLYLLLRDGASARELPPRLKPEFAAAPRVAGPDHLDLRLLAAIEAAALRRVARSLCCHQDIAATSCLSLAMLAEFDPALQRDPALYRILLRHAGLLGQVLYLESEALGYRGTGIGCYFDDALHELLGLDDRRWQSLYHFAIGIPVHDTRIQTLPAYADRTTTR